MYMYIHPTCTCTLLFIVCVHVGSTGDIYKTYTCLCFMYMYMCTYYMYIYILISVIYTVGKFFDNTSASEPEIVQFPGNERVIDVQTGSGYILALTESGSVYTWGKNSTTSYEVCVCVLCCVCLSVRPSVRPSVCLSVCLSVYLSICFCVCVNGYFHSSSLAGL